MRPPEATENGTSAGASRGHRQVANGTHQNGHQNDRRGNSGDEHGQSNGRHQEVQPRSLLSRVNGVHPVIRVYQEEWGTSSSSSRSSLEAPVSRNVERNNATAEFSEFQRQLREIQERHNLPMNGVVKQATPTRQLSSSGMFVNDRPLDIQPHNLKIALEASGCCTLSALERDTLNCDHYRDRFYRPPTPPGYFSSDSTESDSDEETASESDTEIHTVDLQLHGSPHKKRFKGVQLFDEKKLAERTPLKSFSPTKVSSSPYKPSHPTTRPKSGRLRPYPYVGPVNFKKSRANKEDIISGVTTNYKGKTALICLEEYFYCEYVKKSTKPNAHQYKVSLLGDLGPLYGKLLDVNTNNNTIHKRGKKDKKRGKAEASCVVSSAEQIDESKKRLANLCDNVTGCLPPIRCFTCKCWIKSSIFVRHVFDHLWEKRAVPRDSKQNWCYHCNRNFESDIALKHHYLTAGGFGKYFCMICLKNFNNDEDRMEHLRSHHPRHSMPYVCPVCPYSSSTLYQFSTHYEETHCMPICHLCHQVFTSARGLIPSVFCSSSDRQDDGYELFYEIHNHLRKHIEVGEKYACEMCTLSFTSCWEFISHQKATHTNIKLNNMLKMPASHNGFKKQDMVLPGDALKYVEFYRDENKMISLLKRVPNITIPADYRSAQKFTHQNIIPRPKGRKALRPNDVLEEASSEGAITAKVSREDDESTTSSDVTEASRASALANAGNQMSTDSATAPPDAIGGTEIALSSEFSLCKFDTLTVALCSKGDERNLFNYGIVQNSPLCNECGRAINPAGGGEPDLNHPNTILRCSVRGCQTVSTCGEFMRLHGVLHKKRHQIGKCDLVKNFIEGKTPQDFMYICLHCKLCFSDFLEHMHHMHFTGHLIMQHSFQRENRSHKSKKKSKLNWMEELNKIVSGK